MKDKNNLRRKIMKKSLVVFAVLASLFLMSCNDSFSGEDGRRGRGDRSQRGIIDSSEYIDFTTSRHNANMYTREHVLQTVGGRTFKNGESWIKINTVEGTIEMSTSEGFFEGEGGRQIYAKFSIDVLAASSDCLYLRRNLKLPGVLMVDTGRFDNDAIPDISVCLPLYGFSRNRIEVSSVMDGFIAMPSGTYWRQ